MTLLIVIPSPLALQIFLKSLIEQLRQNGYNIHVICKKYEKLQYMDGVQYHFIDFERNINLKGALRAARAIRTVVADVKPDLIHCHFSSSAFITFLAKKSGWPKMISTIQGAISTSEMPLAKRIVYGLAEIISFRAFNKTFVLTEDDYIKLKPFVPSLRQQKSLGFGCDLNRYNDSLKPSFARKDLGLNESDFVLIYIGRMVSFKGFPIVLRTFRSLQSEYPHVKLIICGQFDPIHPTGLNNEELEFLKSSADIIKPGFTSDVYSYLSVSDLNFFPSTREGLPVNLMESLASGVPVLTSNSRGCRHVVFSGITGIVSDRNTVDAYKHEVISLMNRKEELQRLKSNCKQIRILFDRQNYVNETMKLYKEMI